MGLQANLFKESCCILRGSKNRNHISIPDHIGTAWNGSIIFSLNSAEKNIAAKVLSNLLNALSIQFKFRHYFKFQKFYLASGKSIDLYGGWKTQKFWNLLCRCQFRVDDHGYAQTLLDKTDLLTVNRITHTGNCVAVTSLLGDQTAQKVHLIWYSNCDKNVCCLNSRFHKSIDTCSISNNAHSIYFICNRINPVRIDIDQSYISILFLKLFCKCTSNFSTPDNYNLHKSSKYINNRKMSGHRQKVSLLLTF